MPDLFFPYKQSNWDGEELKFAIRSFVKHTKFDRIFVMGDKPEWLQNVVHIPFKDLAGFENKEANIKNKILEVCKTDISDPFIFANDDIFICRDIDLETLPFYYDKELTFKQGEVKNYRRSVNNTYTYLKEKNLPVLNYDIHIPIKYHKGAFQYLMNKISWRVPYGYIIKSLYCNSMNIEGVKHADFKISGQTPFHRLRKMFETDFVSIGDNAIGVPMRKILTELFNEKSKFEV